MLSPTGSSKSYAPLNDDAQGPLTTTATRTGAIVYSKRLPSAGSNSSSDRPADPLRSESEETLSPLPSDRRGNEEDGDLGSIRRASRKGKERAWDPERGDPVAEDSGYPPTNEDEDEERKIQEHLAQFAARDMAKRRAARLSRQLPPSPDPNALYQTTSGSSGGTSSRRPLSTISESFGGGKRNSIMGAVSSVLGTKREDKWDGDLPLTATSGYQNPYDPPAYPPTPRITTSPAMTSSPRMGNPPPPLASPTSPVEGGFTYGGPAWRGGAAAIPTGQQAPVREEKWWHSLCAWGDDLDGGHGEDQSGRTNPFE